MAENKRLLLEDLKFGIEFDYSTWHNISLADLLTLDDNRVPYFYYACKNRVWFPISTNIRTEINNSLEALYICAQTNYFDWIINVENEDLYFQKTSDGQILIDYIFKNSIKFGYGFITGFKKRVEIFDYVFNYKKGDIYQISSEIVDMLLTKQNGEYPIDKYITDFEIKRLILCRASKKVLLSYCNEKNAYDLLKDSGESLLLNDIGNGKKLIDELFDRNIDPTFYNYDFSSMETMQVLIARKRFDLLYNADISLLLSPYNENQTYLDVMIEKQKQGIDVHLEKMSFSYYNHPSKVTALELIKLAQNDLEGYIPSITLEMLLYKSKKDIASVLEFLIEIDKNIALTKIIPLCRKKNDPSFVVILKNLGIEENKIQFLIEGQKFSDEYIEQFNENYAKNCVSVCPELLAQLKELFYKDGKSDKHAIDALIASYQYLTSLDNQNNKMFILELQQLIEIKKHNPDKFIYTKTIDGASFSREQGVFLSNYVICTINHETSHALHYYLANELVPENYFEVITNIQNDSEVYNRVADYSQRITELTKEMRKQISKSKIIDYFNALYQGDKLLELALFLAQSKQEQKQKFKDDYSEQVLDTILARTFSLDEFFTQMIETETSEIVNILLRNNYDGLIAIGDILDAIFIGKYKNGVLLTPDGVKIEPAYGHGIGYYQHTNGFLEMIANYGTIIKSKNNLEMLQYLRSIVGDELVDMLKEVYEQNILNSQVYLSQEEMEVKSYGR